MLLAIHVLYDYQVENNSKNRQTLVVNMYELKSLPTCILIFYCWVRWTGKREVLVEVIVLLLAKGSTSTHKLIIRLYMLSLAQLSIMKLNS